MNKKELYELLMSKISKHVKSKLLESANSDDIIYYVVYNDYNKTYNIYTSLTPGINDILDNTNPELVEEYDSIGDLHDDVNDYEYTYVYDKWGDKYNKATKYYILYDEYNNKFLLQTIEGLKTIGFSTYPIIEQSDDLKTIVKKLNELL